MKHIGTVSEIASVLAFLASNNAAYMTCETLHISGGLL